MPTSQVARAAAQATAHSDNRGTRQLVENSSNGDKCALGGCMRGSSCSMALLRTTLGAGIKLPRYLWYASVSSPICRSEINRHCGLKSLVAHKLRVLCYGTSQMWHLASEAKYLADVSDTGRTVPMSVLFLMPCHSTPWHASLHPYRMERLRALDCSPPPPPTESTADVGQTGGEGALGILHETDLFYSDPEVVALKLLDEYQEEQQSKSHASPLGYTHIAMFSDMAAKLQPLLEQRGFSFSRRTATAADHTSRSRDGDAVHFFHAHIIDDSRASSELVLVTNQFGREKPTQFPQDGTAGSPGA
eukprot:COSAG02_NODE_799_length_17084_cov_9.741242_4_plen_304_part_00